MKHAGSKRRWRQIKREEETGEERRGRDSIRGNKVQKDNNGDMKWKAEKRRKCGACLKKERKKVRKEEKREGKNSTWGRQEEMKGKDRDRQGEGMEERK